jgi:hypothetical protein
LLYQQIEAVEETGGTAYPPDNGQSSRSETGEATTTLHISQKGETAPDKHDQECEQEQGKEEPTRIRLLAQRRRVTP